MTPFRLSSRTPSGTLSLAVGSLALLVLANLNAADLDATMNPMGKSGQAPVPCADCAKDDSSEPNHPSRQRASERSAPDYAEAGRSGSTGGAELSSGAESRPAATLPVDSGALLPGSAR